jgi:hypothetical protein
MHPSNTPTVQKKWVASDLECGASFFPSELFNFRPNYRATMTGATTPGYKSKKSRVFTFPPESPRKTNLQLGQLGAG